MRKNILTAFLIPALSLLVFANSQWVLQQSTLTYHVSHPLHQVDAVAVKSFDSGDSNRDLHMLQVTRGAEFPIVTVRRCSSHGSECGRLLRCVRQFVDIYQLAMAERHHEVTSDLEEHVVVDADLPLLNRVVSNLLENELVHLPVGCRLSIRLHSCNGSAELVIEDNGPGFPPDIANRAFERFVKGKHSPGHGLGLAFVDAVVRAHNGVASISGRPGGGAIVTVSLPVRVLKAA